MYIYIPASVGDEAVRVLTSVPVDFAEVETSVPASININKSTCYTRQAVIISEYLSKLTNMDSS